MKFTRRFTTEGIDPYESVHYEMRASVLRHWDGSQASREMKVEVPSTWSKTAGDILAQKYLRRKDVPNPSLKDGKDGKDGAPADADASGAETSVRQVVDRLAGCWRHWGESLGYFDKPKDAQIFYDETVFMLLNQMAAPNSPQWFNTGLNWKYGITGDAQGHYFVDPKDGELKAATDAYSRPQPHACFIQAVEDDLLGEHGVYSLLAKEGRIFKYGSGTGTNFSAIRAAGESLQGGGISSGLMSFLKVFDRAAGAIKSGGTTRRAAKMVCLDLDHPEIEEFITWKSREESKVAAMAAGSKLIREAEQAMRRGAGLAEASAYAPAGALYRSDELRKQGLAPAAMPEYDTGFEGEAYATVSGQNSNNSVRVPNRFLDAVRNDGDWELTARTNGAVMKKVKARALWDLIGVSAWESADPGVQFDDTINEWHTCPKDGAIRASNPCSEYMFLDDTACNLASLNLVRFQNPDGSLRIDDYRHAVRIWTIILDISVGMAQFPSKDIARKSYDYRTLGLGYANLGAFLMRAGIPYDSPEAMGWTGGITALMGGEAYAASAEMAEALSPFPRYGANKSDMLRVLRNHQRAAAGGPDSSSGKDLGAYEGLTAFPTALDSQRSPQELRMAARLAWEQALKVGIRSGYRNAQVTVLAPTGTIGLLMDCDTTGIEPDFALVKFKSLSGGGFIKIVNQSVPVALRKLGYAEAETSAIVKYCLGTGTLTGSPGINPDALLAKGFTAEKIAQIEKGLSGALTLTDVFAPRALGIDFLASLGLSGPATAGGGAEVLEALGFTQEHIDAADLWVCGAQTVEGAPGLKPEHQAVFDCANPCGRGIRHVTAEGHLRSMAAAQPFLSGAISKTVNMPGDATVADVQAAYMGAWNMMIKAVAIYRDGSKLSQPLNSKVLAKAKVVASPAAIVNPMTTVPAALSGPGPAPSANHATPIPSSKPSRKRLPTRRGGFVQEATVGGHKVFLRTGEYPDGSLGEIFIDMYKEGAGYRGILNCFAVLTSKALQYGIPLEELVDTFTFTRFEPAGPVEGHENIKNCTSILDFIFRILGLSYLGETDFVHVKPISLPVTAAKGRGANGGHGLSGSAGVQGSQSIGISGVNGSNGHPSSASAVGVTKISEKGVAGAHVVGNGSGNSAPTAMGGVKVADSTIAGTPGGQTAPEESYGLRHDQAKRAGYTGESCSACGSVRVRRNGTCIVCEDCGTTSGCS